MPSGQTWPCPAMTTQACKPGACFLAVITLEDLSTVLGLDVGRSGCTEEEMWVTRLSGAGAGSRGQLRFLRG